MPKISEGSRIIYENGPTFPERLEYSVNNWHEKNFQSKYGQSDYGMEECYFKPVIIGKEEK